MNSLLEIFDSYPAVYADIFIVFVLALILYLFTLFLSKLLTGKETAEVEEPTSEASPEVAAPEEVPVDLPPSEPETTEVQDAFKPAAQAETAPAEEPVPAEETVPEAEVPVEEPVVEEAPTAEEVKEEPELPAETESVFSRLRKGLSKTQTGLFGKLDGIFSKNEIDQDTWDEFEESLISSDIGVGTNDETEGKRYLPAI